VAINLESSRLIVICRSRLGESWCGDDGADSDKGKKDFRGDRRTNGVRLADDVSSAPAVCFCGFARNGAVLRTSRELRPDPHPHALATPSASAPESGCDAASRRRACEPVPRPHPRANPKTSAPIHAEVERNPHDEHEGEPDERRITQHPLRGLSS
jgi:hypothetical protein